jgi:hypothetical protein
VRATIIDVVLPLDNDEATESNTQFGNLVYFRQNERERESLIERGERERGREKRVKCPLSRDRRQNEWLKMCVCVCGIMCV